MTGIGDYDWWEEEELEQDENRGQEQPEPRKAWKHRMYDNNNEDGNANP